MRSPNSIIKRLTNYLVDSLRSGPEFLIEQKLLIIAEILDFDGKIHFQEQLRSLSENLRTLLVDLQYGAGRISPIFNAYSMPLMRISAVKVLVAMYKRFHDCSSYLGWQKGMELARQDPLLSVRKLAF